MKVSFSGYGERAVTFETEQELKAGVPVQMSCNGTVAPCGTGKAFCGVVLNGGGGLAAVQLAGYVRLPYSGTAPMVGYQTLAGDGSGKIKSDAGGRSYLVVDVDTEQSQCGIIL